jgi:hypothetical protein
MCKELQPFARDRQFFASRFKNPTDVTIPVSGIPFSEAPNAKFKRVADP